MTERFISNVVIGMREFQRINCIKNECVTNVQYLYDCFKINSASAIKAKPVIVVSIDDETQTFICVGGHLIILLDDNETIIDPSYDVFSLKNKSYYDNIKDLMDSFNNESKEILKQIFQKSISKFLEFIKLADRINNGELVICDKKFYNNQADYIEKIVN
uniref:Uncharacterized protein n=1 Tax=viral metagenome TaxID=1070528 RepID=A0A6C0LE21_9ZZZZ